ncbi:MAG: hypothetical protein ACFFDH_13800 [Promethearchaeota archaeon]
MRIKTKLFFFFFFIFSFFLIPYSFVDVQGYTPTIRADWLYITTGTFQDNSPHGYEKNIKISSGGIDLLSFENLGIISYSDDEVLYKARTEYGFEITAHTDSGFNDIYPYINLNKQFSEWFLKVSRKYCFDYETTDYNVKWNSIDLGPKNEHNYDGVIPVSVGIRDIIGNTGTISLNGQTFETPSYVADIVRTKVTSVRLGEVGGYEDQFIMNDVSEGTVHFQELDDDFTASESKIIAYLNTANLGWTAGSIQRGQTLQQAVVGGAQTGTEYSNPTSSDLYTFYLDTRLQPQVYEMVQYNTIRYAHVKYGAEWCWSGLWEVLEGPAAKAAPKRITAVHVDNQVIHWEFEVIVDYYATVESTAELTQAILDDPFLYQGDMVWDVGFTGDYDVEVTPTRYSIGDYFSGLFGGLFGNFWTILIIIIVVGVVVYIFIKIGIPLIRRRIDRRGY